MSVQAILVKMAARASMTSTRTGVCARRDTQRICVKVIFWAKKMLWNGALGTNLMFVGNVICRRCLVEYMLANLIFSLSLVLQRM